MGEWHPTAVNAHHLADVTVGLYLPACLLCGLGTVVYAACTPYPLVYSLLQPTPVYGRQLIFDFTPPTVKRLELARKAGIGHDVRQLLLR